VNYFLEIKLAEGFNGFGKDNFVVYRKYE